MALTLTLDTVKEAEIEQSLIGGHRLVRTGIVRGLTPATVTNSKLALLKAIETAPGMPLLGDTLDASYPTYVLRHRIARGVLDTGGGMAWIWLHYATPGGGGTPLETFAAEDDISTQVEPYNVFPGTPEQLLCSVTSTAPVYELGDLLSNERSITVGWPRSIRSLVLYGLFADQPSTSVRDAVNTVNSATWQGLGRGRWRCVGAKARYSSKDGMYAVTCGFLTKGAGRGDDWSTFEIPIDPSTGKRATVDTATLATEYDKSYTYGKMSDKNAIWHAGLYQTSNFSAIFGDTFPIGD